MLPTPKKSWLPSPQLQGLLLNAVLILFVLTITADIIYTMVKGK